VSTTRNDAGDLVVVDADGDRMIVERFGPGCEFPVIVGGVGLVMADGLAVLAFLADALGVERYVVPSSDGPRIWGAGSSGSA